MTQLLDTCIVIDFLRGKTQAADFLERLEDTPAISVITLMELTAGVRGRVEEAALSELFGALTVYDVDSPIAAVAGRYLQQYTASHAVEPPDALIAATASCLGLSLVTQNLKHFPMFKDLLQPY